MQSPFGVLPTTVSMSVAEFLRNVQMHHPTLQDLRAYVSADPPGQYTGKPPDLVSTGACLVDIRETISHRHGQLLWDYIASITSISLTSIPPTMRAMLVALQNFCVRFVFNFSSFIPLLH